ncbi:phosphoenolpyruvate synthase, partial [Candidatus Roizmanbacteria bacterium]|nr:phosphoenolpyruvate synthase [Candidatus Roizmanbacteria bacterium]
NPQLAFDFCQLPNAGVGLARLEFIINNNIGVHPKAILDYPNVDADLKKAVESVARGHASPRAFYVDRVAEGVATIAAAFWPKPVIVRLSDFKSNEYRKLIGGSRYEPEEENPMLGFRGASRYIQAPEVFELELEAIKRIWEMGYRNVHMMIPFVRAPWELIKIKNIMTQNGMFELPGFKLWIMVEVPACALQLEEFIKIGIDGVSIGTNDLTMMLMGVDRDNEEVSYIYDERCPAVSNLLEHIVNTCSKYGITCSICGQAASDYPELVERLVKAGITSVSVNPDAIERTRELIHDIEKKLGETK